jgi:PAS domain S-box-containing protein
VRNATHDPARLLRVEHAVMAVLREQSSPDTAFRRMLAAVGRELGWQHGAVWEPVADGAELRCAVVWHAPGAQLGRFAEITHEIALPYGRGLPGRVVAGGAPAWATDLDADSDFPRREAARQAGLRSALCFPVVGESGPLGAVEFMAVERHEPDEALLGTLTSLGTQVGQFLERRAGEAAVRESEARKRAMLDAALDCVITIDHAGTIVEVNAAITRVFGYAPEEVLGRELAEILVPPALRERHRQGLLRAVRTGRGELIGRRVEIVGMTADGREVPVELTITRIGVPGKAMFTGYVRDITERRELVGELRASRARIVQAADAARRRLERDLHDGAQSRLVALGLDLRFVRGLLPGDPEGAAERLDAVLDELTLATDELRELARGIHPAVLTERGLAAALRTLARRSPVPVELDAGPERRMAPAIEATAYFVVAEALTNVVRYADAEEARVTVRRSDGLLSVEVSDDGRGGADPSGGSGLRGIADRLAALDGRLAVDSPPGGGTTIRAEIPCAS